MLVERFAEWAASRADVVGAALIGSHARGDAGPDSDVDLLLVTQTPRAYLVSADWTHAFGLVDDVVVEEWGAVTSLRVRCAGGPEVELGVTGPEWVRIDPVDPGTARVVRDGFRILFDRYGTLHALAAAVSALDEPPRRQ